MIRAYEDAVTFSLRVSLTKQHCASFDEKSHEVEILRSQLEKRALELPGVFLVYTDHDRTLAGRSTPRSIQLFSERCAEFRRAAHIMRDLNAKIKQPG